MAPPRVVETVPVRQTISTSIQTRNNSVITTRTKRTHKKMYNIIIVETNLMSGGVSTMFSVIPVKYALGTLKCTVFYLLIVSYFLHKYTFFVSENQYDIITIFI